ncbi:hypothetical protein GCM10011506_12060 [Marivirga lumbricoides]|uniref:Glycosyltransferase n=2 Tax=Marivirga lumbricoides TaxID=1046115 RepID=A0ABQ1LQQ6_9BACT|nr:hypothetical protein GCM10011506_12060 [Marivirga lumbricoides]
MRILFIIPNLTLGGIQKQVLKLATELTKYGYYPIIAGVNKCSKDFIEELKKESIEYYDFSPWWKKRFWSNKHLSIFNSVRINRIIYKKLKPEVIFSYTYSIAKIVNTAWQFSNAKKSFFMERSGVERYKTKANLLDTWAVKNSSLLITNSKHASKELAIYFGVSETRTSYITNFIERSTKELDTLFIADHLQGKKSFLMTANFFSSKNHELLVQSWKQFAKRYKDVALILIGQSLNHPFEPYYDEKNSIYYLGSLKNANAFIKNVDVTILASYVEGCPNVVLEYLAEGKIFIGSDIPAIREIIPDQYHNTLLFDNHSIPECLSKLEFALNNIENKTIINHCKEFVLKNYSLNEMMLKYLKILDHV